MAISLVIPTLNASRELLGLLSKIADQTCSVDEVLIIDSSSDDDTVKLAESFPGVRVISILRSEFDHGGTRHLAFEQTEGRIVLFMTQDAIPERTNYIEKLIKPFDDPGVAMTSGRQLAKPEARRFEQLVRAFNYPQTSSVRSAADIPKLGIKTFFASDVCSAYKREAYLACGGFERPCGTNEDMLMAARFIHAGYKVAYAAEATVFHSHNLSFSEQYRRNREVGFFLEKHSEELGCPDEVGEGGALVRAVTSKLLSDREFAEIFAFGLDCAARLLGNRSGRIAARRSVLA